MVADLCCEQGSLYNGGKWYVPLVQTHPAPSADASVNPMYYGMPGMSLYTLVGHWDMLLSSVSQSSIMSAKSEASLILMVLVFFIRAVLSG